MVVVDVDREDALLGEKVDRHAVDVAAIEENGCPVSHIGRGLVEDLLEWQKAILDR